MMSTLFCNVFTCKRFSSRLALAFFFLSLGSSADPATEATLQDVKNAVRGVDTSVQLLTTDFHDMQQFWTETRRDNMLPAYNDLHALRLSIENAFGNSDASLNYGPWLKEFLLGAQTDPYYTKYPQFRTLGHHAPGTSQGVMVGDNVMDQSLTFFLSTTLGSMYDSVSGPVAFQNEWGNYFTTNSSFYRIRSASGSIGPGGHMYGSFPIWLAEAIRRQINNSTNLVTADWRALNGFTNPVQAVQASMDQSEQERSISNEVASVESDLNDLFTVDEPDNPSGYDNTDDFSDVVSSLGDDEDSLEWGDTIRLASSSQIHSIASEVGVNYAGPSAEISLNSFAGGVLRTDLVSPVGSLMVSVWHWIRSLAIFWVVVGWYNRVRALLLMTNPEPSTSGPFRDAGGIW